MKHRFRTIGAPDSQNRAGSLGLVGGCGFLLLLAAALSGHRSLRSKDEPIRRLAVLNLMAVLLGTIGGFGLLVAPLVSPPMTFARMNVLIGFFALFAVVLLLDRLRQRHPRLAASALPAVLLVGLFDQTSHATTRLYEATGKGFASDQGLVRGIEAAVPSGTLVFQLPYASFSEGPAVNRMGSYDPIRPYLHSSALRWSLPTLRGSRSDRWVQKVSKLEPARILDIVANVGFGGILLDRQGYADEGSSVQAVFGAILDSAPLLSDDGRLAFFSLANYARRNHTGQSAGDLAYRQYIMFHPIGLDWEGGCYAVEHDVHRSFRWCADQGEIRVVNDTAVRRTVSIHLTLVAAQPPAHLKIESDLFSSSIDLAGVVPFTLQFDVPPGSHVIRFDCAGRPADAPGDPRMMIWRIEDFLFEELPMVALQPP